MADALCGPSNALQNFQKHTTVDRTLQQDRLVGRHSPAQGFRSSPGPNAGALDSEFEAFQAGRPAPPQNFQHFSPHFAQPPPNWAQAPQAPDWAADFQRLNVSTPPPQIFQQQRPQAANAASSWGQDFMRQQTPVAQAPAMQQNTYGRMSGYGVSQFGGQTFMQTPGFQQAPISDTAQGKQRAQDAIPAFDEAAFEQAFAQAQQDMLEVAEAEQSHAQSAPANPEVLGLDRSGELDPLLVRIRETRPAVYSAIQVWSETGLGRTEEAVSYLDNMDRLEKADQLVQDANEAKWIVDSLQRIVNRDAPQEVKTRAEKLITAINQRLMSHYPLGAMTPMTKEQVWDELEAAGYMRTPEHERVQREAEPEQETKEEQPPINDADEMAATAGRLLERVADNTSEKFQNSQFLGLMRRLRDREVVVQEDKIVEVSEAASAAPGSRGQAAASTQPRLPQQTSGSATQIPGIDPTILEHAAMDFETPIYSDAGYEHKHPATEAQNSAFAENSTSVEGPVSAGGSTLAAVKTNTSAASIPRHEQDEDLWRYAVPGRDPVTQLRGPGNA